ncbi:hypothetical protein MRX96_036581 [Rhipicephalus microplus]
MRLIGAACLPGCKVDQELGWASCGRSIEKLWDQCLQPSINLPPPTEKPLAIDTGLGGLSKRRSPICALLLESVNG